ncbi:MAG TPA: DUF2007 domain-containing protein [Gammaproteobacteria bacterium]
MRKVFRSKAPTEAALVRNLLVEEGIDAKLFGDETPYPGVLSTEVWVTDDADAPRALELIRRTFSAEDKRPAWRCAACGEGNPASFELCWSCGARRS